MKNLHEPRASKTLWIFTTITFAVAALACGEAFNLTDALRPSPPNRPNALVPPQRPARPESPAANASTETASLSSQTLSPEGASKSLDRPLPASFKFDSYEAAVRLPTSQVATDKQKLEEEAFAVANGLVSQRPQDSKAIHVAAVCNSQLNKTLEAQRLWLKCVELNPGLETYYLNLAANALFRGDTEFALNILEKAEANGLQSGDVSHHKGLALARLGEDERAIAVLKKAIEDKTATPAHWMLIGQSQLKLGEFEDAKSNLLRAVELGVRNRALYVALMNTSVRLKQTEEAAKYRAVVESMGDDTTTDGQQRFEVISDREARRVLISVLAEASSVYRDAGMLEDSELSALRLLAIDPGNHGMCRFLADLYKDVHKLSDEIVVRERIIELAPNDLMNYLLLARAYADSARLKRAEATLKLGISVAPSQALGYAAMAEFLVANRQASQAKWYAVRALEREPSPAGYKLLASILRATGDESAAQQVEQAAQAVAKDN